MQTQERIARELNIDRTLARGGESQAIQRRIDFIKTTLHQSGCKALVLGISGGVDSLTAGRLCQLACEQLREAGYAARFIAMRLPYNTQADEGARAVVTQEADAFDRVAGEVVVFGDALEPVWCRRRPAGQDSGHEKDDAQG